ncbi:acetyltransferase (GNAT) family protein [bacterium BMS3Bbin04]|nr:acetyltransferase (GNAT) family protein [bacterium BMS3Bbin04]
MSTSGLSGEDIVFRPVHRDDLLSLVHIDEETSGENRADYLARKLDAALDATWNIPISNVVEVKGDVVGFIMVQVASGEFGLPESVATIDTIGILPVYNGKGLAGELFSHTVTQLRKLGVTRIQTLVDWLDQDLIGFFASRGFAPGGMLFLEKNVD